MTLECLRSLFDQTQSHSEVIVVDNASTDGSADAIEKEFGSVVHLVRSSENLGFAAANNRAAEMAKGTYLLLLNPDTVVLDHAVDRILSFAKDRPVNQIYGGKTVFADGSLNVASCWGAMTPWSLFCRAVGLTSLLPRSDVFDTEALGSWNRDTVREVDIVVGCFLLIKKS